MSVFKSPDLVPLWDRPPEFMPMHPPGGAHHWRYEEVKGELIDVSRTMDKAAGERRVALLNHPELDGERATEGLHVGLQLLLANESAGAHRHTPGALRIGLEGSEMITEVGDQRVLLDPLDVVLNPSGTWHGHHEEGGVGAVWLDVVDLPLVAALGGVLFEPGGNHWAGGLLEPPGGPPEMVRFPWSEAEARLSATAAVDGVRTDRYGEGSVLPTMAVTAHLIERDATLTIPARTVGTVVLAGRGRFRCEGPNVERLGELAPFDVVSLRSWTPASFTGLDDAGVIITVDTSPAAERLGLYREQPPG